MARLTVPGVLVGVGGAWFASKLLRTFVFGVDPRSLAVLAGVGILVLLLAAVTALPSVRRAMRLDPRGTAMS